MSDPEYAEYIYKGWYFEVHSSHYGPSPLEFSGNRIEPDQKFWDMYDEFNKLDNKEDYRL